MNELKAAAKSARELAKNNRAVQPVAEDLQRFADLRESCDALAQQRDKAKTELHGLLSAIKEGNAAIELAKVRREAESELVALLVRVAQEKAALADVEARVAQARAELDAIRARFAARFPDKETEPATAKA